MSVESYRYLGVPGEARIGQYRLGKGGVVYERGGVPEKEDMVRSRGKEEDLESGCKGDVQL